MSLQDIIKKFQTLPPDIQQALSSDEAMAKMEALEGKYNLKLASFVLRAAVREFPLEDLGIVIRKELNLKPEQAGILKDEILDQVFAPVVSYYAESAEKKDETSSKHEVSAPKAHPPLAESIKYQVLGDADKDTRYKIQDTSHSAPPRPSQISEEKKVPSSKFQVPSSTPPPQPPK